MTFLSSLAVIAATRLGFKLAEKKKWLPKSVYHQLAVDKLRQDDLAGAIRLNEIALEKDPQHEKAQIIKDLIAMRRDAILSRLLTETGREKESIRELQINSLFIARQLDRLNRNQSMQKILSWVFLFGNLFTYLASYLILQRQGHSNAGFVVGGVAVICTLLIYFLFRRMSERDLQRGIKKQELVTAQRSTSRELEMRARRLRQLQSKLSETRHQLREH
ncbi:hypothetical protein JXA02_11845 [candidate division KSB1 bacterium]|nr:hypothetical protein [candidate division KSB1 bacterium]RQW02005.1 MAG: hypothetical protein EH222_14195 [candidate division KSB1 bacterium]